MHAFNLSNLIEGTVYEGAFKASFTAAGSATIDLGGIAILTGPTGAILNLSNFNANSNNAVTSLPLPFDYLTGSSRVVAMGFEVVNTTSDLYRQGLVTVYRQPQPSVQVVNYQTTIASTTSGQNLYLCNDAPQSIDRKSVV